MVSLEAAQAAPRMGYVDAAGTPSAGVMQSMAMIDASIGRIMRELQTKRLSDSTWIVVSSPFGQSPMDRRRRMVVPLERLRTVANGVHAGVVAHMSGGSGAMIWLADRSQTAAVVKAIGDHAEALGVAEIFSGARLALTWNSPEQDGRMPDIVLQANEGVLWMAAGDDAMAAYGGMGDEDAHVALLVAGAQLTARRDPTWVPTTQLAPLLLRALGLEKFDLQALHREHTPALPGIF
jgi:arylsulfatase A-like enzyme